MSISGPGSTQLTVRRNSADFYRIFTIPIGPVVNISGMTVRDGYSDYTGFEFWLLKLIQFNGDYVKAEMVKAFISADEYRQRFGP